MNRQNLIRRRICFYGIVQGVGFRWVAQNAALAANATGWVHNEYDGSVTMEIQGTAAQIAQVLDALENARYIRIERTASRDISVIFDERRFAIK